MIKLWLTMGLVLCICCGYAQLIGNTFPTIDVETVESQKIILPSDVEGKYALIGFAHSQKSEHDLMEWLDPVYQKFIKKTTGFMAGLGYDIHVYFVPMFTGIKTAATGVAKKIILETVDPLLLPHILLYKGTMELFREKLNFEKNHVPYFFLLNPKGEIIYTTSGKYDKKKMDCIEDLIE